MKVRNGFVSNSSSSSFILIVERENAIKILDNMEKTNQGIKNKILAYSVPFKDLIVFHDVEGNWEPQRDFGCDEWEDFREKVCKCDKDCFLYDSIQC